MKSEPPMLPSQFEIGTDLQLSPKPPSSLASGMSVVVPVYNSRESLSPLVERLEPVLNELAGSGCFELILVNDGSTDDSWSIVQELAQQHDWVRGVDLMRNFGQHNAVLCGLRSARFDVTVTMDDDLQHPPEEFPKLVAALRENIDVVYGYPQNERHGFLRNLASKITKAGLQQVMGASTARHASALRIVRTRLRDAFCGFRGANVSIDVLLTWSTQRFAVVPVRHAPRTIGHSHYTFIAAIKFFD